MTDIFIKWLVPFICGSIVTGIGTLIGWLKSRGKRNKAIAYGVQALLRAEIIRSYEKYITRGYIKLYAKEALRRAYESYHALGGNDVATGLYSAVDDLPVVADDYNPDTYQHPPNAD